METKGCDLNKILFFVFSVLNINADLKPNHDFCHCDFAVADGKLFFEELLFINESICKLADNFTTFRSESLKLFTLIYYLL